MDMELIGNRLRQIREIEQLSLEEASERTGIKLRRLKNLENGKGKLKLDELFDIMESYDVIPSFILGETKVPIPVHLSDEENQLLSQIRDMSAEKREELQKNLEADLNE